MSLRSRKDAANQSPCQNKIKNSRIFFFSLQRKSIFIWWYGYFHGNKSFFSKFFVIRVQEGPLGATITALSLFDQILAEMSLVSCDFGWRVPLLRVLPHNTALLSGQKPAEMTPRCCGKVFFFLKSPEFALLCASTSLSAPHLWPWGPLTFVPLSCPGLNVQWHVVDMSSGWHHVNHVMLAPWWFYSVSILSTSSLLKPQGEVTGEADQKGEKRKLDPLDLLCSSRIRQVAATLTRTGWNIN